MTTEQEYDTDMTRDATSEKTILQKTDLVKDAGQSECAEDYDEDQEEEESGSEEDQDKDASIADSGEEEQPMDEEDGKDLKKGKKTVPGIVYIGHIPPRLRPRYLRTMLGAYGEIGRIFLMPESKGSLIPQRNGYTHYVNAGKFDQW